MAKKGESKPITCGHTDRKHFAYGLCRRCYANRPEVREKTYDYRRRNPEKTKAIWVKHMKKRQASEAWRPSYLKRLYNITPEEYDIILLKQNNKCAICKATNVSDNIGRRLAVDHDHETGTIRGLLCTFCNQNLGKLEKNRDWTKLAEEYLKDYPCK